MSATRLFGTVANTEHIVTYRFHQGDMNTQYTESVLLLAMDAKTGRVKWRYQPQDSIRHNAIAIGDGRVHLIDRPLALSDRKREQKRGTPDPGSVHPSERSSRWTRQPVRFSGRPPTPSTGPCWR